jgi:hypothetical protein
VTLGIASARGFVPSISQTNSPSASRETNLSVTVTGITGDPTSAFRLCYGTNATTPATFGDLTGGVAFASASFDSVSYQGSGLGGGAFTATITIDIGPVGSAGEKLWVAVTAGSGAPSGGTTLDAVRGPFTIVT